MCFTKKKVKAYLDFLCKFYLIIFFLFWKHLVGLSTIMSHKSVYTCTTDNTIFMEFSRNTEVVFISCRRIEGRE